MLNNVVVVRDANLIDRSPEGNGEIVGVYCVDDFFHALPGFIFWFQSLNSKLFFQFLPPFLETMFQVLASFMHGISRKVEFKAVLKYQKGIIFELVDAFVLPSPLLITKCRYVHGILDHILVLCPQIRILQVFGCHWPLEGLGILMLFEEVDYSVAFFHHLILLGQNRLSRMNLCLNSMILPTQLEHVFKLVTCLPHNIVFHLVV
mmetsp:Transcript_10190/g.19183  ORF Transcript_10190/g.19183 Transcript_10190/m.19183 type:complete len:205 (+) Transcript_10190:746-1360(+)